MSPFKIWVRGDFREDSKVYLIESQMDNGNNMPQSSWVSPPPYEEVEKIGVSTALSI